VQEKTLKAVVGSRYRFRFRRGIGWRHFKRLLGRRRAEKRTALCLFVHSRTVLLDSPMFPAVGNRDANLEETRLAIDAHAVLKPLGSVVPSPQRRGAVNNSPVGAVCDTANWNPPRHKTP
jgi:hypothetical protein